MRRALWVSDVGEALVEVCNIIRSLKYHHCLCCAKSGV